MNNYELLLAFGVGIIICFQFYNFIRTNQKIALYKKIFPNHEHFEIIRPLINKEYLNLHPKEVLFNLEKYIKASYPDSIQNTENVESESKSTPLQEISTLLHDAKGISPDVIQIELIAKKEGGNEVTDKIIYSLNTYLIRNKGVASDFHLVKDVVERNCDSVEEDINQTISLPLYLGLLGTFLGIVIGLVQISGIDFNKDSSGLDSAISILLKGVLIAMVASFMGLFLTVLNSGLFFKGARAKLEEKKNDFYTFIQTDLLPLLNQNINSTLFSLQSNLHKFNEEFKGNVSLLSGVMGKNHNALIAQEKILTTLDNMDITEFGKANLMILKELKFSTEKFAQFNQYLFSLGELLNNTKIIALKVNEVIDRSNNFDLLGQKIVSVFNENQELAKFLQNHYSSLDNSHQLITQAVNNVGNTLEESLEKLKIFTQERISEIQQITLREIDLMQNQYPEKWKKLDNLTHLESLNKNVSDLKMSTAGQIGSLTTKVVELNDHLIQAIAELEQIKVNSNKNRSSKMSNWVRKLFRKRKIADEGK